jgi:hypothetical protein
MNRCLDCEAPVGKLTPLAWRCPSCALERTRDSLRASDQRKRDARRARERKRLDATVERR